MQVLQDDFEVKSWLIESEQGQTGLEDDVDSEALEDWNGDGDKELVMVIDDLADMRKIIATSLQERGYRVICAPNGRRGLDMAVVTKPDLIVTDWMMPQMTGPDLIKALKNDSDLSSIPVVLLTAKSDEESKLAGTEIGADAFLGKPFNQQELLSTVRNLLV